ncbi:glycosyltransferase family 4 protein [Larkinella harenae]
MKVAYMLGGLDRGGLETMLLDTIRQINPAQIEGLVIYRKDGALKDEFTKTGISLIHLPFRIPFSFTYFYQLRKILRSHHVQIVHAQLPFDAFLAYWACFGTSIRVILSVHGYDFGYNFLTRCLVKFILLYSHLNIYVSESLKSYYISTYSLGISERQQVVYNGVDFTRLDRVESPGGIRKELGIPSNVLVMGCIGNFVPVRDHLLICHFLNKLKEIPVDFHFIFAGARNSNLPHLYDDCVNFCQLNNLLDRVHFIGSRRDIPVILNDIDAFVYASNHDTFGIAVVEAMSVGKPVFVNDWSAMMEITENGRFAQLYKTEDSLDLLKKIEYFLDNREFVENIAQENNAYIRDKYSINTHINKLIQTYTSLLHLNE